MSENKIYFYVKILSLIGVILAIYLLWQQVFQPGFKPCSINAWVNCDSIISGPVSKIFGVPTPLIGLLGYIVIFISSSLKLKRILLGMASFGLIFCLWIAYQELIILKVICPVCILCQIAMISVFALSVVLNLRRKEGFI